MEAEFTPDLQAAKVTCNNVTLKVTLGEPPSLAQTREYLAALRRQLDAIAAPRKQAKRYKKRDDEDGQSAA